MDRVFLLGAEVKVKVHQLLPSKWWKEERCRVIVMTTISASISLCSSSGFCSKHTCTGLSLLPYLAQYWRLSERFVLKPPPSRALGLFTIMVSCRVPYFFLIIIFHGGAAALSLPSYLHLISCLVSQGRASIHRHFSLFYTEAPRSTTAIYLTLSPLHHSSTNSLSHTICCLSFVQPAAHLLLLILLLQSFSTSCLG